MRTLEILVILVALSTICNAQWAAQTPVGQSRTSPGSSRPVSQNARSVRYDWDRQLRDAGPCGDTFSIAAVDTATREIGSAGASCIEDVIWISSPLPNKGIVHTQASSDERQRNYARQLLNMGRSPQGLIDSLVAYDTPGYAPYFQYGAVDLVGGGRSAAYTGTLCYNWKGHLIGPTYAIQGNILSGAQILDSMKARFLNSTGTLAERLMGSLMGAKVRGADTRCWNAGTSSISAFVRVVRPDDPPGGPYFFELNVDSMYGREPIDSLQTLFTQMKTQAFLRVDANTIDFGRTDVNVPYRDTTFVIRNAGGAADSIYIWIDYITVSPDSAATISPSALLLKPGESRALTFRIRPRLITQNGYYTMGIMIDSRFGIGKTHFEKAILFEIRGTLAVGEEPGAVPEEFVLGQNYPNPFNPSTTIRYGLPNRSHVTLTVFNTLGQQVAVLQNGDQEAGYHEVKFGGSGLSSGVYFYRIEAGSFVQTHKLLLLR